MQPALAELEFLVRALVERDLPGALVVACDDVAALHVAQLLARLDERSESDLFLTFTGGGATSAALVDGVAENLALQRASLEEQLGPGAALPTLPPLAGAPARRMLALLEHVLGLLPPGDHRLVWSLLPSELPPDFSAELAEPLLRAAKDPRVRLVLRVGHASTEIFETAQAWPDGHVLAHRLEIPAEDGVAAAIRTAQDPERPAEARVRALLELAYLDLGHGRLDDAEQKFRGCAEFYARTQDAPLEALALAGVADVLRARDRLPDARLTYETALLKVAPTQAFPVALQIAVALADTCVSLQRFADAEGAYRLADALADALLRPHIRADVQESLGACRLAQRDEAGAAQIWAQAADLCRALDYPTRLHSLRARLAARGREVRPC
jgi:tetratricopeptide (TPR) repeat protein